MEQNKTPTFADAVNHFIDLKLLNIHTSMPAIVEAFNAQKKTVDVLPAIKKKLVTGEDIDIARINNVPVAYYQSDDFIFSFPLKKGDSVQLIFNERSIDNWRKQGGVVAPKDVRKFDYSDAVAYPCLKHDGSGLAADGSNALIQKGDSKIKLSNGKLSLQGASDELIDLCQQLATACSQILTNTQIGPQPPVNIATFTQLATKFGNIKL